MSWRHRICEVSYLKDGDAGNSAIGTAPLSVRDGGAGAFAGGGADPVDSIFANKADLPLYFRMRG
ncbi:hypothetical protein [Cohnella phaseoli]|uniref:hypothetical protein n=1 Tax=Cohnella phaseoli TaxID=456490 RepID=UPI000E235BDD|nr:hypothetical protein [Cohnella phaseoli]